MQLLLQLCVSVDIAAIFLQQLGWISNIAFSSVTGLGLCNSSRVSLILFSIAGGSMEEKSR